MLIYYANNEFNISERNSVLKNSFRSDNFDSSLSTLVQLGTSALKVGMSAVGEQGGQQFASKVGVASGGQTTQLTPEEILHKQQVRGGHCVSRHCINARTHVLQLPIPITACKVGEP